MLNGLTPFLPETEITTNSIMITNLCGLSQIIIMIKVYSSSSHCSIHDNLCRAAEHIFREIWSSTLESRQSQWLGNLEWTYRSHSSWEHPWPGEFMERGNFNTALRRKWNLDEAEEKKGGTRH
jgi:hypothetical protein